MTATFCICRNCGKPHNHAATTYIGLEYGGGNACSYVCAYVIAKRVKPEATPTHNTLTRA